MISERSLLICLFKGCFLRKRANFKRKEAYCLYSGKASPVEYVADKVLKKIKPLLKAKGDTWTIDLRMVRRLHGNSWIKKYYKQLKTKQKNGA